ncbi:hypothetical protein MY4824_004439 [Beauveria thailandica]
MGVHPHLSSAVPFAAEESTTSSVQLPANGPEATLQKDNARLNSATLPNSEIALWRRILGQKATGDTLQHEPLPITNLDENLVGWDGQQDSAMPFNFSTTQKWIWVWLLSAVTFVTPFSSSILSPAIHQLLSEFGVASPIVGSMTVSIFLLGYAVGPIFIAPLSETYGRHPVLIISNSFFCVWQIGCALAPNIETLVIARFLSGLGGAACLTLGGSIIGDLFRPEQRGFAIGIWNIGPLLGPSIGPLLGGFVTKTLGWRWDFWIVLILAVPVTVLTALLTKETSHKVLMHRKTMRLRKELNVPILKSCYDHSNEKVAVENICAGLVRPIKMLVLSPLVFFLSLYIAFVFGVVYLLYTTIPAVFMEQYAFDTDHIGLIYLALGLGNILGWLVNTLFSDRVVVKLSLANNGVFEPEMRLLTSVYFGIFLPVTLFWYGWSAYYNVHVASTIISLIPYGFGIMGLFLPLTTYIVDCYPLYAASAIAANVILRSVVGAFLPLAGPPIVAALCALLSPPSLTTRKQAKPRNAFVAARLRRARNLFLLLTTKRMLNRLALTMAATATASAAMAQSAVDPDLEDSNVSSPLTEVDDKDDNDDDIDRMQIDGDNSSLSGDENAAEDDHSDSATVLSDAGSDANSEGNDTEAETERLFDTPRNQRQRDVVVDQYNNGQVFEHTPSKLRRAAKPEDKDDDHDNEKADRESVSGDEGSGALSAEDADNTTLKSVSKTKALNVDAFSSDSQDRKRKRSPVADQFETEQPQKRRSGSVGATSIQELALNTVEEPATNADSANQSDADDEHNRDTGTEGDAQEHSSRSSLSSRKSTRNGRGSKDSLKNEVDDTAADAADAATETAGEEVTDHHEDEPEAEVEAEDEDEADIAAKNQEEMERKQAAFKAWSRIEEMFGIFRDRLYTEKLQRVEEEEQSLLADVPTHREYLNMKQCLDDRLNQRLQQVNTEFDFQLKANERWAVAQRAQIWSQFFQAVREKREQTLESLNKQWYDVQAARRNAHSLQDYGILFPKDPTQRLRNAIAYNSEVSTLAGMAKFEGFPAGPEMKGASALELKSDLSAMERTRRGRQKSSAFQQRDDYQSPNINQIGPAGEQFLKDTPWANPNHSSHKMARQGTAHEENRVVPQGPIFQNEHPASSLKSPAPSTRLSESPEMSRSILKPSPHQMKRVASVPSANRTSKATAA